MEVTRPARRRGQVGRLADGFRRWRPFHRASATFRPATLRVATAKAPHPAPSPLTPEGASSSAGEHVFRPTCGLRVLTRAGGNASSGATSTGSRGPREARAIQNDEDASHAALHWRPCLLDADEAPQPSIDGLLGPVSGVNYPGRAASITVAGGCASHLASVTSPFAQAGHAPPGRRAGDSSPRSSPGSSRGTRAGRSRLPSSPARGTRCPTRRTAYSR